MLNEMQELSVCLDDGEKGLCQVISSGNAPSTLHSLPWMKINDSLICLVLPSFRNAERIAVSRTLDMSGLATFFATVAATMLQTYYGVNSKSRAIDVVIGSCWFISLIFSISSALNSLLCMAWRQSPSYVLNRSLWELDISFRRSTPFWCPEEGRYSSYIHFWLVRMPMYSLVIAAVTFTLGLCLFAFSTNEVSSSHSVCRFTQTHFLCRLPWPSRWLLFRQLFMV